MIHSVFVYGALRSGASHAWRMKDSALIGPAKISGTLVKVDWYPGLVLSGEGVVLGEVYAVSDEVLAELDVFEGVGVADDRNGEYARVKGKVSLADGSVAECWVYEWLLGVAGYPVVANGDWLTVQGV